MRKFFLIILAMAMALATTACGNSAKDSSENSVPATALPKPPENDTPVDDSASAEIFFSDTSEENSEEKTAVTDTDQTSLSPTDKEENDLNITITVNGRAFSAMLYDNETAKSFRERLPLTLDMSELNGNEKYYYLSESLPTNSSRPSAINAGDIMLYGSDCLVIFYESFSTSYSYTPIGKIDDPNGLSAALGSESVQVTFN